MTNSAGQTNVFLAFSDFLSFSFYQLMGKEQSDNYRGFLIDCPSDYCILLSESEEVSE